MKYAVMSIAFLFNNELISLVVLMIMMLMFFADILKARFF